TDKKREGRSPPVSRLRWSEELVRDAESEACLPARRQIGDRVLASRGQRSEVADSRAAGDERCRVLAVDRLAGRWILADVVHRSHVLVRYEVDVAVALADEVHEVEHVEVDFGVHHFDRKGQTIVEVELARPRLERLVLVEDASLVRVDAGEGEVVRQELRIERRAVTAGVRGSRRSGGVGRAKDDFVRAARDVQQIVAAVPVKVDVRATKAGQAWAEQQGVRPAALGIEIEAEGVAERSRVEIVGPIQTDAVLLLE